MSNKIDNKDKILIGLNKMQKAALLYTKGPLRVIAGAGSGKTRLITHKIAYLIHYENYDPKSILAITFTNRAANEMIERVKKIVGKTAENIQISTYHSLALKILRKEIGVLGYPRNFNVLDTVDQKQILAGIYKNTGGNARTLTYSSMIDYISKSKMSFITPEEQLENSKTDGDKLRSKIYFEYLKRQETLKSLDFDDLLIYALKILKKRKSIAAKWSEKYKYVLVDEFQDTSNVQYEMVKILSGKNITIVGDPDQTIYTWRGADVNLILNFDKDYRKVRTIKLEENYRSTKSILKAANRLIRFNKKRLSKVLYTNNEDGEEIHYERLVNQDTAARWIVRKIKELQSQKIQLKNMAVFYRSNYLSKNIEQSLITENIEYKLFGSLRFYERKEIKDVISYLKIIVMNDDVAFNRMINIPSRKIGEIAKENILALSQKKGLSIMNTVLSHFDELPITKMAKTNLKRFLRIIKKHRIAINTNKPSDVLLSFLKDVGYVDMWRRVNEEDKIRNLREFVLGLKNWETQNPEKNLTEYFSEISLFSSNHDGVTKLNSFISLMTIHSAKGLEYDYVFILGISEGVFPSIHSLNDPGFEAMEEERRLAYVAITRAKKFIYLVGSQGFTIDGSQKKIPSRFIGELGLKESNDDFINYSVVDYELNYSSKPIEWVVGDKLLHKIFGKGTVVKVNYDTIDIKFKKPFHQKTLMKNHKSIKSLQ